MSYLKKYGKRKFQEGGMMPPEAAGPEMGGAPAGPDQAAIDADGEAIIQLAEATTQGDMQAAQELGVAIAPIIMQQVGAAGAPAEGAPMEGAPMEGAPAEGAPVFKRGGKFVGRA